MANEHDAHATLDRRDFFKTAGAGLTAAAVIITPRDAALAQEAAHKAALERIAANTYPIRPLFKSRFPAGGPGRPGRSRRRGPARSRSRGRGAGAESQRGGSVGRGQRRDGRAREPAQRRADEGEVRRDHDAGLPAVHQGHVSRRDADGPVLGALRRRHRRHDVLPGGQRAAGRLRPAERVRAEVAGEARQRAGQDRHEGPAHLEQRAVEPGRVRVGRKRTPSARRASRWPSAG